MASVIIVFSTFCLVAYAMRLNHYSAFEEKSENEFNNQDKSVAILIPFKDEGLHLESFCNAIRQQTYNSKLMEFVFVDDHSIDNGAAIIEETLKSSEICYRIIRNNGIGKKTALATGVEHTTKEWILATDADCIPSSSWISSMVSRMDEKTSFIAGPVKISNAKHNWLTELLNFEHLALQRLTYLSIGKLKPLMANGANMAFRRALFLEAVESSLRIDIQSGDDTFLLFHAYQIDPKSIQAVSSENALVNTMAPTTYRTAINQRIRWASKIKAYTNVYHVKETGWIIAFTNLSLIGLATLATKETGWYPLVLFWFLKSVVDFYFTQTVAKRFNQETTLSKAFMLNILYPFFFFEILVRSGLKNLKKD